jgi:lincosamide nucleotidyltransferase A/C/D/E
LRGEKAALPVEASDVLEVLDLLGAAGVAARVGGGWGIGALVGAKTRTHKDVDLAIFADREAVAIAALETAGFRIDLDWRPTRLTMRGDRGRVVDLHPPSYRRDGSAVQSNLEALPPFEYPKDEWTEGRIGDRHVECLRVEMQVGSTWASSRWRPIKRTCECSTLGWESCCLPPTASRRDRLGPGVGSAYGPSMTPSPPPSPTGSPPEVDLGVQM